MKLLIFAVIVLGLALTVPVEAAGNPGIVCGKDVSAYKVLNQQRFFDKDEALLMESTALGYPGKVYCLIMTIFKDGNLESIMKSSDTQETVTNVRTCVEQSSAEYEAAHEDTASKIAYSTILPY